MTPRIQNLFDLSGKTALVTGGARGIGLAIARGFSSHGANVVIADVDAAEGARAERSLLAEGLPAHFVAGDITASGAASRIRDAAYTRFGSLDILINNAGMSQRTPAERYSVEDFDRIVELNLKALFFLMRAAAERWIAEGTRGKIVNLASFAGVVADPLSAPYAATKGGVVQLTRTCAVEWARHGILVNAIAPGYTRTEMTVPALSEPSTLQSVLERTPLGRVAEPEDLAGAAVFLASRASDYVTGHILMVDGGWTAI